MPATVNSSVLSTGMTLAEGTSVCPRATKKSRKARLNSSAVVGRSDIAARLVPGRPIEARVQLHLPRAHRGPPLGNGGSDGVAPTIDDIGRREALGDPPHSTRDRPRGAD